MAIIERKQMVNKQEQPISEQEQLTQKLQKLEEIRKKLPALKSRQEELKKIHEIRWQELYALNADSLMSNSEELMDEVSRQLHEDTTGADYTTASNEYGDALREKRKLKMECSALEAKLQAQNLWEFGTTAVQIQPVIPISQSPQLK